VSEAERKLREIAHNFPAAKDETSGIAVSGGSDSMAMLHLLAATGRGFEAVTVDHGLRPEAADEVRFVAGVCAELKISHTVLTWDHGEITGNLQDRARRARYGLMQAWALARGLRFVSLAHTLDDQAETFLMRVGRGAGIDGLLSMEGLREDRGVTWVRPFLTARRRALREYLNARRLAWIDDPSNEDERFERVRIRKAMVGLEAAGVSPESIWEVINNLFGVWTDLQLRGKQLFEEVGAEDRGQLVFQRSGLRSVHAPEVCRRTFIKALMWVSGAEYPPRAEAVLKLSLAIRNGDSHTVAGCLVSVGSDEIRFCREFNAVKDLVSATDALWDGRWKLDGPHAPDLEVRALGEAVKDCPDWRQTSMPRASLLASPAVWNGSELVAAPLAGLSNGWTAGATGRGKFADFLLNR